MGVDTSTIAVPFAVFEDKKLEVYGIEKIKAKYLEDKIYVAYDRVKTLIQKYKIDVVVFEDVYYGLNFTTTKSTLQVMGAMRLACYEEGVTSFLVPSSKWRKGIISNKGRAGKKEQAIDYVNEMYDLDLVYDKNRTKTDDDIAEAILMTEGLVWERYSAEKVKVFNDKVKVV